MKNGRWARWRHFAQRHDVPSAVYAATRLHGPLRTAPPFGRKGRPNRRYRRGRRKGRRPADSGVNTIAMFQRPKPVSVSQKLRPLHLSRKPDRRWLIQSLTVYQITIILVKRHWSQVVNPRYEKILYPLLPFIYGPNCVFVVATWKGSYPYLITTSMHVGRYG